MRSITKLSDLRAWHHVLVFLFALLLIISRRPDAVFNAQFWGEDGSVFFANAYNLGWLSALFSTYAGYVEVFPRLGAALALLVPLSLAPLVLNLIAICLQVLPANLLLSSRSSVWGSLGFRALLAITYLASPNCGELNATITNSQWFLALLVFLLLVASEPKGITGRVFDLCILVLCGLSGPFCVFLIPIAIFLLWRRRKHWPWIETGILAVSCLVQLWGLLNGGFASRSHPPFGADLEMLVRVLAGQFYIGSLIGVNPLAAYGGTGALLAFACVAAGGTILLAICFYRSPRQFKLFLVLSILILVASFTAPQLGLNNGGTVMKAIALGAGARYWFFTSLAIEWMILWSFPSSTHVSRSVAAILLSVLCFGIIFRWEHRPFQDTQFAEYARRFESAPAGTVIIIPENPPGRTLQLVKHSPQHHVG